MNNIELETLSNEEIIKMIASLEGINDGLGVKKDEER